MERTKNRLPVSSLFLLGGTGARSSMLSAVLAIGDVGRDVPHRPP
jgi:hypothetical protein